MMSSTCIVRTAVVRKPGLVNCQSGLSLGIGLGFKNLVLFTSLIMLSKLADISHSIKI